VFKTINKDKAEINFELFELSILVGDQGNKSLSASLLF